MSGLIDQVFWWIGASVSVFGAAAFVAALCIGLGYLAYNIVLMYRIACLVVCVPLKTLDCAAYRAVYRFKYAVRFIFGGVPTEMCVNGYGTIFHVDWIKDGQPDDGEAAL